MPSVCADRQLLAAGLVVCLAPPQAPPFSEPPSCSHPVDSPLVWLVLRHPALARKGGAGLAGQEGGTAEAGPDNGGEGTGARGRRGASAGLGSGSECQRDEAGMPAAGSCARVQDTAKRLHVRVRLEPLRCELGDALFDSLLVYIFARVCLCAAECMLAGPAIAMPAVPACRYSAPDFPFGRP